MHARPVLDRDFVASFKRRRIADAIAELSVEKGYRATTVGDIVARAKVGRSTVYDQFAGKEEILLDVLDRAIPQLLGRVEAACRAAGKETEPRLEAGLRALLAWVAEEPAAAWVCFVESACATPGSLQRYHAAITRFTALLRANVPSDARRPATTEETLVGGVASIFSRQIERGEVARAADLLPGLLAFLRAPYLSAGDGASPAATPPPSA
jgi:AcrR family transcriptional regulator